MVALASRVASITGTKTMPGVARSWLDMSAEQSLIGAMGCASWRSRDRLREHAALAPVGGTIRGTSSPTLSQSDVLGLNEVGVTDLVMATLWRFGPRAAAYAVSPAAEANHLGADIAILHPATERLLLYQAKLARLDLGEFMLKSAVTTTQLRLLKRRSVMLDGFTYQVTGRLALYQVDETPFIHRCAQSHHMADWWGYGLWGRWGVSDLTGRDIARGPEIARRYYDEVLAACLCSPSGIVAAPVPRRREPVTRVSPATTWPWEFEIYEWFRGQSPLDNMQKRREELQLDESTPQFDPYVPTVAEAPSPETVSEIARQLTEQLRLPISQRLYLVVLG
jgi:hypothetical protein